MVLRNVDSCFAEQCANTPDDTGNGIVGENQQRITQLYVDVERANSSQVWRISGVRIPRNCDFLHPASQPDFDAVEATLRDHPGRRQNESWLLAHHSRLTQR